MTGRTQVAACPKCGAPMYAPMVWHGVIPPSTTPSCACFSGGITNAPTTTNTSNGCVVTAVDRAREALAFMENAALMARPLRSGESVHVRTALEELLAEIDAHWVDTRELDALLKGHMFIDSCVDGGVIVVGPDHEIVAHAATAAEAIRAAREAAGE